VKKIYIISGERSGDMHAANLVLALKDKLELTFPAQRVVLIDERYTSKMAMQTLIAMGSKKKDRKEKAGNLDKVSAAIILQSYLERQ
jgi:putative Holliday junction resolvase